MHHLRLAIGIILSTLLPLSAQSPGKRLSEGGGRLAWFVQTGIPEGLDNPVTVMTGKATELITLSNRLASGPVKIPEDGIIRLVRKVPDPADPKKSTYLTLAEAKIPEAMDQALIILVPTAPKAGSDLLFQTKVQGLSDFRGGDSLYINLTNLNVAVEIGSAKIPLKPGNSKIYDGEAYAAATTMPFRYSYFDPEKEKWKVLSASLAIMSGTRREIWIFSVDAVARRVKCHGVTFPVVQ